MVYGIGIGVGILVFIVVALILRKINKSVEKPEKGRIGYVKTSIKSQWSHTLRDCTFKVETTGLEFESGKIEIKVLEIINYDDNSVSEKFYALKECKKNFKYINKNDVNWETNKPLTVINDGDLSRLLNNEEICIGDINLKIENEHTYDEIINLMIKYL